MGRFVRLLVLLAGFSAATAFANPVHESGAAVSVHIRTVRASERLDEATNVRLRDTQVHPSGTKVQVDSRIRDLAPKLGKLHYRCFRLISSQREVIALGKRQKVPLVDGNMLMLRPLTLDSNRVGMWIKWKDATGMQILDTRMHFDHGESMLTGIEDQGDSGLILAIDVVPVP